ncbi:MULTISPECIES: ABC-F family ATP-binding cassette domain-containing protein [Mucilaginibacter]|uniref:ABC-F family ATP-binding cassette domain-containing protein n=1 Tax=Mucilaginibacter TaxID=423349 RepID=UPI002090DD35|nr:MULTISPECIES: ATP-binding cassette domain-containing protein [Mucilaginibacter]MCO5934748.1 ATP-binding cassette domain-containing protein [Mucilaginibacter aurantiaciroseus]MEB0260374.1 ATP-binding cassette domain-containing protein [Mucilaginibacter sp. 10I4]MEB0279413.1 ATP-binding cassette domain-containing protein [Mucilaginibacter sp. 10B2]MEB0300541.1 ATP-binding cassette domain-containing protein [Mucilaginibacter sp. 5C4]WPX21787.1 ATP-binding cassette domain-containing protein [Mu
MITVSNLSLRYGKRTLFEDVNLKFSQGNCYGVIGANGAGKSTFMKILSGEIDPSSGTVSFTPGERMAVLSQDHYAYDEFTVLETVMMGHKEMYAIMKEKDAIYLKEDFSDADGERAGDLENLFAEMDGWNAESNAATLLSNLGIKEEFHYSLIKNLDNTQKVRVLLAQALFGKPDILLLDEPTNDLDIHTITWLEDFLATYEAIVLVVSHDRHFLDTVCTHVVDIDFAKMSIYTGNYTFWYESSQLALKQRSDQNKKTEERVKELQEFIRRFSANASKSKQATSRKKALDKINLDEIQPSNRKYPGIIFNNQGREIGDQVLQTEKLGKSLNGEVLFANIDFMANKGDKIAVLSQNSLATSAFYDILTGRDKDYKGSFKWGVTVNLADIPIDNSSYFKGKDDNLIDWLREYSAGEKDDQFIRGFLGRMLFSGEEVLKKSNVLSGGEKMRCMFSRMMLQSANMLILDEPTNHLDLESITALNNGMKDFRGNIIFTSRDHELIQTVATRIIELTPGGIIDKLMTYDEYINSDVVQKQREEFYAMA